MSLPKLLSRLPHIAEDDSVVLVVYAPFGSDDTLSHYPDDSSNTLEQHPLYQSLLKVAEHGVNVVALIDLVQSDTILVTMPAHRPEHARQVSRWKQDMSAPHTLAGLLHHAHLKHPTSSIVLALEGHGAGYLPEIDRRLVTAMNVTENGRFEWKVTNGASVPEFADGSPVLPMGCPTLPMGCPTLPVNHMPLSTWGIGDALARARAAGVPALAVIHFNNCFNMAVELLHTVRDGAEYATGYCNYNFFTSGEAYPNVFEALRKAGSATTEQLALWFADFNHDALLPKGNHPTIAGVVELSRMNDIAGHINTLSNALLSALDDHLEPDRAGMVARIRQAIIDALNYDTDQNFLLDVPDQLTDLGSFATHLLDHDFGTHGVKEAAMALQGALKGIKRYGDTDSPWMDLAQSWNFGEPTLAMNIFLPDPELDGLWDWRSPYYLRVAPDPGLPNVQPHIIDFLLTETNWRDFLIEYHRDVKFVGLLPAGIPSFPVYNAKFEPPRDGGGDGGTKPPECKDDTGYTRPTPAKDVSGKA